jgi:hypothetical protein
VPPRACELAHDALRGHGDHFHRQREAPSTCDLLGFVGDADEAPLLRRDDLLARERRAAAP